MSEQSEKTIEFIKKARKVHGGKYDYSLVDYKRNDENVIIICAIHGEFKQRPSNHLNGANCYHCGMENKAKNRAKNKEDFITECQITHGNKYDYSLTQYTNCKEKIKVICPTHGIFELMADNHKRRDGCSKCNKEEDLKNNKKAFLDKSVLAHNNKYDYSTVEYINSTKKVKIICPIHGEFEQTPNSHSMGRGCYECSKLCNTYKREDYIKLSKTAILYIMLLEYEDEKFYKIGKTKNTIKRRFFNKTSKYKYSVVNEYVDDSGIIFDLEIELHKKYHSHKYEPKYSFSGRTECYRLDLPINEVIDKYKN
mgnify:CR=1 FL=1